ncbi:MAG: diaminopimelate decarboxylase [Gemmatimonadetes bacterium]|nr:diaminopimelate decarboxylase [Gemmatimonadota bacterium]
MGQGVLTSGFTRAEGGLACEGVPLERVAREVGTPTYVYSSAMVRDRFVRLDEALVDVPHRIHYTLKANSNAGLLRLLKELGAGVDVVSGGELFRALRLGFTGDDIVFGGVGKTDRELREAVQAGVKLVNAESEAEVRALGRIASEEGTTARVGLRVNPEVTPYVDGVERLTGLLDAIRAEGIDTLRYLDIGGGLGVSYSDEVSPDLGRFAKALVKRVVPTGLTLLTEPGRFIVGNAGVLLTRVLYRKHSGGRDFLITDAGMTELIRPSHYDAYHRIESVRPNGQSMTADVVGPICESGDFLALGREMDDAAAGDLLAVHDVGAYGYVMASNYNTRPRGAEVLVEGERYAVVTLRERD